MKRDYPPAVLAHHPYCTVAPAGLLAIPTREAANTYPNGRPHNCLNPNHTAQVVIETVHYPPHEYEASTLLPNDAVRALCRKCRGTHNMLDAAVRPVG